MIYGNDMHQWEWVWMSLWMIGILTFTILIIALLARRTPGAPTTPHANAALDTLAQRYALGEIDEEEYTRRREILQARQPHS